VYLIVIAKAPEPGRVKTRLCPPCTPEEAAAIAEAALADTLDAVRGVPGVEPVVVLDGTPGKWLPADLRVIRQRGSGLAERIAAAFADAGAPSLLIGMDTPQVEASRLTAVCQRLGSGDVDAVIGPAADGGWWAIGLTSADPDVFAGIPMSTDRTFAAQKERLRELALRFDVLPVLRDVDRADDAAAVAAEMPGSRFACAVEASAIGRLALGGPRS